MKKYFVIMTLITFFSAKIVVASDKKKPTPKMRTTYAKPQAVLVKKPSASNETGPDLTMGEMIEKAYLGITVLTNQNNEIQKTLALLVKNQEIFEKKLEALQTEQKKIITLPGQLNILSGSVKQVDTKVDVIKKSTTESLEGINKQLLELSLNIKEFKHEYGKNDIEEYHLWPSDKSNMFNFLDNNTDKNQENNQLQIKDE